MDGVGWLRTLPHTVYLASVQSDFPIWLSLLLVLALIILNGFFSAAEMAIVTLNDNKIRKDAAAGDRYSRKVLRFIENTGNFLATIQVGVTLAGFLSSAIAGDRFGDLLYRSFDPNGLRPFLHTLSIVLVTIVLAYFTLIFGELVPKRIALNNPDLVSRSSVTFIRGFEFVMKPFTRFLTFSSNLVLKAMKIKPDAISKKVTEEEIRMMIDVGSDSGEIHSEESIMLQNIFEFNDKEVSEIMVHRKNIVGIPLDATYDEVLDLAKMEGYTRIPVYEEHIDQIVGILNTKDLLYFISKYDRCDFDIKKIMREPLFTPDSKNIDALFREMQKRHEEMAIAIDEYGGVAGLVTMEDLVEEIVGNIQDEYDDEHPEIIKNPDGTYLIDGLTTLDEASRLIPEFSFNDEDADYDTIAGLVLHQLDRIPDEDEKPSVDYGRYHFDVLDMDGKRIAHVRLSINPPPVEPEKERQEDS